ncbi:MAG: hypothetical protein HUU16_18600 [Candidatus Omnitrophica bacterium]|nr:hypothetical protein [Candidatus Omnitrophota bacterium]
MRFLSAVGGSRVLGMRALIGGFLSCFTLFPVFAIEGDVNLDGFVDAEDLLMVQENWHEGLSEGAFSGSQKCAACHEEIYQKWRSSLHSLLYRDPSDPRASVLPPWSGDVTVSGGGLSLTATLEMRGASEYWAVLHFADGDREYRVDRVHGGYPIDENEDPRAPNTAGHSKWIGKQRYHTKIGEAYYILPFQWNPVPNLDGQGKGWGVGVDEFGADPTDSDEKAAWVGYNLAHWVDASGNFVLNLVTRPEERNCAGCHQAGVKPEFDAGLNQFQHNAIEPNIACENCHGPGGKHIVSQDPADITNPEELADMLRQNETCGQCHSRGESIDQINGLALEYPYAEGRTFRPGDSLEEFYHFNLAANQWPDGTAKKHHQQFEDFMKSAHFPMVRCWDCHDPHGSDFEHDLVASARDNTLCLRCHDQSYNSSAHTHHDAPANNNGLPRCVDCHMPPFQPSGVNFDIHAHVFKVALPQGTLDHQGTGSGQPNACAICHRSENGATDTNIGVWNAASDITIATYLDGFADTWWGDYPTPTPTPDPVVPTPTPTTVPNYLGSAQCLTCHANAGIVDSVTPAVQWQNSLHAAIYRDPDSAEAEFLIPSASWTGNVTVSSTVAGVVYRVTATLEIRNTDDRWFVVHFADGDREYKVDRVHGGKAIPGNADPRNPNRPGGTQWIGKQRFQTVIGDSFYILPFQYNPTADLDNKRKGWVAYNPNNWVTAQGNYALNLTNRAEERNCAGCHQQGVRPELVYNNILSATQFDAHAVEPNIGCENCHGPGGNHPALAFTQPPGKRGIIVPSMLDNPARRLEACGQCHGRGKSVGELGEYELEYPYNGERTYIPGDVLADFYTDGGGDWPDGTSRQHHQQYLDYLLSKHWTVAKFECWECHDPHGSDNEHDLKTTARDNSLCLECHQAADYNTPEHTHHSGDLAGGSPRCVDCHMAAVQNSGVNYDIHNHLFQVLLPERTLAHQGTANGSPNACMLCHRSFGGFTETDAGKWNEANDIKIATLLDEIVRQWWPGALAKEAQDKGKINVILEDQLDQ